MARTYLVPVLIGLTALAAMLFSYGDRGQPAMAATATAVGIDADPTGNTAALLGTINTCRSVTQGQIFDIDIFVQGVTGGIVAFDTTVHYNSGALRVPAPGAGEGGTVTNVQLLLASTAGSNVVSLSDSQSITDTDGLYAARAVDQGGAGTAESGSGVLARVTFKAVTSGKTSLSLTVPNISPILTGADGSPIAPAGSFGVFTGTVSGAQIFVGTSCPATNNAPTANNQTVSTLEDTPTTITLTANDPEGICPLPFAITSAATNGTLGSLGTPTCVPSVPSAGSATVTFLPSPNACSPTQGSFQHTASDGILISTPATITVSITCVNDPPSAANKTVSTPEDTSLTITLTATDIENNCPLSFAAASTPLNGTIGPIGAPTCTLNTPVAGTSTGSAQVIYTPNSNFNGPDFFSYTASDPGPAISNVATASITVTPANDPPVAAPKTGATNWNTPLVITLTATDIDGNCPLTFSSVTGPSGGTLGAISPTCAGGSASATVTYTPSPTFASSDSFTYTATDPSLAISNVATVSITVNPTDNDADGLLDHLEAAPANNCTPFGASPDGDGDGLTDGQERIILGTKCNLADTDGDGSTDSLEMRMTGTATGGTAATLVDTNSSYSQPPASPTSTWAANQWAGFFVRITGGTGAGQIRAIVSNTANSVTVSAWTTIPGPTSTYVIQKVGTNPLLKCAADTIADNELVDASPLDLNDDRSVNILDAFKFFPMWLMTISDPGWDPRLDLNADGSINILDVFQLFPQWLQTCTP